MSSTNKRRGFTLIELLVVIAIIGMLMALLLPAVQAARETARGNTCRSNMRNVALAILNYESVNNRYPGYHDGVVVGNVAWRRPLIYMIAPQLERNDMYERYNAANYGAHDPPNLPEWDLMICPSNPEVAQGPATAFCYNTGQPDGANSADSINNGLFHGRYRSGGRPRGGTSAGFVGSKDGITNTIMLSENIDNQDSNFLGYGDIRENFIGFVWQNTDIVDHPKINQNKGQRQNNTSFVWARPSSNHPLSVNVAWADAHVTKVNEGIHPGVFAGGMAPYNRGVTGSSEMAIYIRGYLHNDNDW